MPAANNNAPDASVPAETVVEAEHQAAPVQRGDAAALTQEFGLGGNALEELRAKGLVEAIAAYRAAV